MAYTAEQIKSAYDASIAQGFTPEQIQQGAFANFGITADQYNAAINPAPAPAPAPATNFAPPPAAAPAPAPSYTNDQILSAYNTSLAQGYAPTQIQQGAMANFGITADQFNAAINPPSTGIIASAAAPKPSAPTGGDIYSGFGAGAYNPSNQAAVGSLIDPRTGGADFSNRNIFDASGNRIASNSGVPLPEIRTVISNILADTSLTAKQQADLVVGYTSSRGIDNSVVAQALGIPQEQADAYLKKADAAVYTDFYKNQRANAALVPLPQNPVPAYSTPVKDTENASVGETYRLSPLFGLNIHPDGKRVNGIVVYDPATGKTLTTTNPRPEELLATLDRLGLGGNLGVFAGLNEAIAKTGFNILPTEQYRAQGSDAGIDFDLLAKGFLGTAYDLTSDPNVNLKGPSALYQLQQAQQLAQQYGLAGANTSLLGLNIPQFNLASLGEGPGGVVPYDLSQFGITPEMLRQGGYQFNTLQPGGQYNANPGLIAGAMPTAPTPIAPRPTDPVVGLPSVGQFPGVTPTAGGAAPAPLPIPASAGAVPVQLPGGAGQLPPAGGQLPSAGAPTQPQGINSQVNPAQTVEGIVNSLLAKDSPYLQRAQAIANAQSNSRGLLNSSIAAGAGTAAAIDAALGIAVPDANIYNQTRLANLGFDQDIAKLNLNQANTLQTLAVQQGYDIQNLTLQQANELQRMAIAQGYNAENIKLGLDTDLTRLAVQNQYDIARTTVAQKNALELAAVQQGFNRETVAEQFRQQTIQNATAFGYQTQLATLQQQFGTQSSTYNAATNIVNQGAQAISQILADPNISNEPGPNGAPSPKQQLIDKQRELTQSQLRTLSGITNVDLSAVFKV